MSNSLSPADLPHRKLAVLDWRVWILGCGAGGCAGISALVALWSAIIGDPFLLTASAFGICAVHSLVLGAMWTKRTVIPLWAGAWICCWSGALGLLVLGLLFSSYESQLPGAGSLAVLGIMSIGMGFGLPYSPPYKSSPIESVE